MEPDTLDGIYQNHVSAVYHYLLALSHDHHLAEDLVQETFLRAYLHLEECPEAKIKPWLFRVAHNAFIDTMRRSQRTKPTRQEFFEQLAAGSNPEAEVLRGERWREVRDVMSALPDRQRQAIVLVDINALSYDEAATAIGVTPAYFKVLLFRARQKVRQLVEGDERGER